MTVVTLAYVNRTFYEPHSEVSVTSKLCAHGFSFVIQCTLHTLEEKNDRKLGGPEIWTTLRHSTRCSWHSGDIIMVYKAGPTEPKSFDRGPFYEDWNLDSQDQEPRLYDSGRVLLFNWEYTE